MTPEEEPVKKTLWLDVAMKTTALIMPFVFAMSGYLFASVADHESRLHSIEESRFTAEDGAKLQLEILSQMPPDWLKQKLEDMSEVLKSIDQRLRVVEQKP